MLDHLQAVILGIIEGLTEFLPVSSTGHLVIAMPLLGVDARAAPWNILLWVSQFGAILAVIVYFGRDLWRRTFRPTAAGWRRHIFVKLGVAMAPTVVLALAFKRYFDPLEGMPVAVGGALIVGALLIVLIDRRYRRQARQELEDVTLRQAFLIGTIQCLSMWPGVSRAGATIMGGMVLGLTPRVATEFSFYLAIPTMLAAAAKTLFDHRAELSTDGAGVVLVGTVVSFAVALVVVAGFMGYVKRYRFTPFAVYRVVLGVIVLILHFTGWFSAAPADASAADRRVYVGPEACTGTTCVQKNQAAGDASSGESSTSRIPPSPGSATPESCIAASRLSSEAHKSPAAENPAMTRPNTTSTQGYGTTELSICTIPEVCSQCPTPRAHSTAMTTPPASPSLVFFGLSHSISL